MNQKLILIGGGGHCESCIDVIESTGAYEIVGILDREDKIGSKVLGYPIIADDNAIPDFIKKGYYFLITIGQIRTHEPRKKIYDFLSSENALMAKVISPHAYVSKYAEVSEGTIIMHHALVNSGVKVGNNCIINTKALIEHGTVIDSHCHISTAAVINGDCIVNEGVFFGSNASCKEGVTIEKKSFIKAHSIFGRNLDGNKL